MKYLLLIPQGDAPTPRDPEAWATLSEEEQQAAYLPRLASGELIGSFALTEAEAGPDPAGLRTTARQSPVRPGESPTTHLCPSALDTVYRAQPQWRRHPLIRKLRSLNLSQFVEDQNGLHTSQILLS